MPRRRKYPDEMRGRAVRMVLDHGHEHGSQWEAICSVAEKLGPKAETVRLWVRQAERDSGRRPGATTEELAELKRLKRENAELRRANDILKAAASSFERSSTASRRDDPLHRRAQGPAQRDAALGDRADLQRAERAVTLGWDAHQIRVIDVDLGRSGAKQLRE